MRQFQNANDSIPHTNSRLLYYIMIDGKSEGSAVYSYERSPPNIWIRIQKMVTYFAVMHKGVIFCVYDNEPFTPKPLVYALFDEVLKREGLDG